MASSNQQQVCTPVCTQEGIQIGACGVAPRFKSLRNGLKTKTRKTKTRDVPPPQKKDVEIVGPDERRQAVLGQEGRAFGLAPVQGGPLLEVEEHDAARDADERQQRTWVGWWVGPNIGGFKHRSATNAL